MDQNDGTLDAMVDAAISARIFPGIVCGVWKDGREVAYLAQGWTAPPDGAEAGVRVDRSTVYDLASLTKILSTAILVMRAVDAGVLDLDASVGQYLPDMAQASAGIRLRSLLTHTSGLPAIPALFTHFQDPYHVDRQEALRVLLHIEPERPEGEAVVYSCTGFMVLGLILERLSGLPLGELFRRQIAQPLGLKSAGFSPLDAQGAIPAMLPDSGIAVVAGATPTEICAWRGRRMVGQVHDESSWCLGGQAGNAGLFGCLDDVAAIASIYLGAPKGGGVSRGVRILSEEAVRLMTGAQTMAAGERRTLGLRLHDATTLDGPGWPARSFGHTGFTGTAVFMDPGASLLVVTLTNRVYYGRESTAERMSAFRKAFHSELHARYS